MLGLGLFHISKRVALLLCYYSVKTGSGCGLESFSKTIIDAIHSTLEKWNNIAKISYIVPILSRCLKYHLGQKMYT